MSGVDYVFRAEARPYGRKPLDPRRGNGLGSRKGIVLTSERLAEQTAQAVDYPLDTGNVIILRYDERAERLPRLLPQNAYARELRHGGAHIFIRFQPLADGGIITVKVKISPPNRLKHRFVGAVKDHILSVLIYRQRPPVSHTVPAAVGLLRPAERLTAVESEGSVKARAGQRDLLCFSFVFVYNGHYKFSKL